MILSKSTEQLRSAGLSQRKIEYIQDLARLFDKKSIKIEQLDIMSDEEISDLLCSVKGIGQVTQKEHLHLYQIINIIFFSNIL